jgi:hypothetical protein
MSAYKAALHASDTDAAMPLYMTDGVFMTLGNQSALGTAAGAAGLRGGVRRHCAARGVHRGRAGAGGAGPGVRPHHGELKSALPMLPAHAALPAEHDPYAHKTGV